MLRKDELSQVRRYAEQFLKNLNLSLVNYVQAIQLYRRDSNWRQMEDWAAVPGAAFSSPSGKLAHAKTQLLFGKLLSMEGSSHIEPSQLVLEGSVDLLLESLQKANCLSYLGREREAKTQKYDQMRR
jgi:hypothetical protein